MSVCQGYCIESFTEGIKWLGKLLGPEMESCTPGCCGLVFEKIGEKFLLLSLIVLGYRYKVSMDEVLSVVNAPEYLLNLKAPEGGKLHMQDSPMMDKLWLRNIGNRSRC